MKYSLKKIKNNYLLFFSILFIQLLLINSQNLCPFKDDEDLIKYYVKGVIPNYNISNIHDFKWEFIHCINGYSLSTYINKDIDDYFYQNSGIFIGSSVDLGKLTEDFINENLTSLSRKTIEKLINISGKFGEEAELFFNSSEGNFTLDSEEVDIINEAVYSFYAEQLNNSVMNGKMKCYTLEMCLNTFYVKFYGLDNYITEARNYALNEQYYMLSFYFLNIKNDQYIQNKIWSLLALSSTTINYNYHHIGFYMDSKASNISDQENIRNWMLNFIHFSKNKDNYYTIGNSSGIILNGDSKIYNCDDFEDILVKYFFSYNEEEEVEKGIMEFEISKVLEFDNSLFNGKYYQRHLIIFLNGEPDVTKFNLTYFYEKGINVILMFRTIDSDDYQKMMKLIDNKFNAIPFYYYEDLNKDNNYSLIMNSQINFYIEEYEYNNKSIEITNISMSKRDNIQSFKIIDKRKHTKINNITFNYFHISLIYNNEKEILENHNNNANITFYISRKYPYTDARNYDYINYCLNNTVSSDYTKSPFINIIANDLNEKDEDKYFYITIIGTEIYYSLRIQYLNYSQSDNYTESNGVFGKLQVQPIPTESIATFSDEKCIKKTCEIDFFSLMKYYSGGLNLNQTGKKRGSNDDLFDQIFDKNMFECLYKNYFCPFFNIYQQETIYNFGPYLGYGLELPSYTENDLFKEFTPLYIINKLYPFLWTNLNFTNRKKTLENNNVILTYEEILLLNEIYLNEILQKTKRLKDFDSFPLSIKLSLFIRTAELSTTDGIKYVEDLHNENYDKYLGYLMDSEITRNTTFESLNFQMLLIKATEISKLKKCVLSIVVGKSMLYSKEFIELIKKFEVYRIGLTYFDDEKNDAILAQYFTEQNNDIIETIDSITEGSSVKEMNNKIDINIILEQQYSLLKDFDYGIKKCIIIISTHSDNKYSYNFTKPKSESLLDLYNLGVNIFDYSDEINFFADNFTIDENKRNSYNFFNTEKNEFIQYVPYKDFEYMADNYLTLFNIINKYPIPINKIKNIYLDLHANEEIVFEFNLTEDIGILSNKHLNQFNLLKFSFDNSDSDSDLEIFISRKTPFPNNYSSDYNYYIDQHKNKITYNIDFLFQEQDNSTFYMMIKSQGLIQNLYMDIEICENEEGMCLRQAFYFKIYLGFFGVGILIFLYGLYICFCEITFKKESNIFDMK